MEGWREDEAAGSEPPARTAPKWTGGFTFSLGRFCNTSELMLFVPSCLMLLAVGTHPANQASACAHTHTQRECVFNCAMCVLM